MNLASSSASLPYKGLRLPFRWGDQVWGRLQSLNVYNIGIHFDTLFGHKVSVNVRCPFVRELMLDLTAWDVQDDESVSVSLLHCLVGSTEFSSQNVRYRDYYD